MELECVQLYMYIMCVCVINICWLYRATGVLYYVHSCHMCQVVL